MVKNHHLAKSMSDDAWGEFRRWVEYFGKVFGVATVAVAPQYTSQTCSSCGETVKKTLSTRTHICPHCGHVQDRDHNAAINILKKGLHTVGHTGIKAWGENVKVFSLAGLSGSPRRLRLQQFGQPLGEVAVTRVFR
ncbi:MAG: transposase [Aphanocapsa sp. GSE-SYN-MK-11-07L]|nr:transposase [Aphanocapsa sp. GSE-SYN-MK-11-07L]